MVAFQQFEQACLCSYTLSVLRHYLLCCKGGSSMVSSCFRSAVIQVHKMGISVHSGSYCEHNRLLIFFSGMWLSFLHANWAELVHL